MRAFVLVLLASCGTTMTASPLNPAPPGIRRHEAAEVEVLSSGPPARPHVDYAMLVAFRRDDRFEVALAKLRAKAGALGCNAIVIADFRGDAPYVEPHELRATCVVYTTVATR